VPARGEGFGELVIWARQLRDVDPDEVRVWVIEDCRHVSGPLERFLLDRGEQVARLAPHLMADARRGSRERGKSDPIDALGVARAALREGVESLPTARLAGPELEIRRLATHRERLLATRTRFTNELRWQLHDLWPEWEIPSRALRGTGWQAQVTRRLARAQPTAQVTIARDLIARVKDLTRAIKELLGQLTVLVNQHAQHLLAERGIGVLTAAKLIGEIAGIDRFRSDAALARIAGSAPIPVSSGNTNRHRLDRGGNRQLNHAFWVIATARIRHDPETQRYIQKQRARGKTQREAIRSLKRHIARRIYKLLTNPKTTPQPALA
jgi:transposase